LFVVFSSSGRGYVEFVEPEGVEESQPAVAMQAALVRFGGIS